MKLEIFSIKDAALQAFMPPFTAHSKGQAIRMFQDELNRTDSAMGKHAEDYDLYHVGEWEDADAILNQHTPTCIARGKDYKG